MFDGGPTMQAEREQIRTVRKSQESADHRYQADCRNARLHIVSNTLRLRISAWRLLRWRKVDGVCSMQEAADALKVKKGDHVRYIEA